MGDLGGVVKRWKAGRGMWPSWVLGTVVIVLFLIQLVVMPSAVQGAGAFSWVERKPAGDVNGKWLACASDATGQRLLAGDNGGRLWISADCGANWLRAGSLAGDTVRNWQACASDASGSTLLAGVYGGRLYVSADSGVSWTTASSGAPTTSQYWKAVASDTGGSTLVAAVYGGRLWLSVNRGITWSEVRPAGDTSQTWQALACDATGLHIMALTRNGLSYVSADRGGTWKEIRPGGIATVPWKACAMNADGSVLAAVSYPSALSAVGRVYRSADGGTTWTEQRPLGDVDQNWQAVAVSADGSRIVVAVDGGSVWTSPDGGVTWFGGQPAGVAAMRWQCCASSADGLRVTAGADEGRLYSGLATWSLSYACTTGGSLTGNSLQTVTHGGSGTMVTAVPDTGYHFVQWSDGILTATRMDTNVTADITVTATFAVNAYSITSSSGTNGTISPFTPQTVNYGSSVTFTVMPAAGYHVRDVLVDGNSVGAVTSCTFTGIMANHTISASFAIDAYSLSTGQIGNGSVFKNPNQASYDYLTVVQLAATADIGWHFSGWSGDLVGTTNPADMTMDADKIVTADFAINTYVLTYTAGIHGRVTDGFPQTVTYGGSGTMVTAAPDTGYHFVQWSDGILTATRMDTNVTADITVTATFAVNAYSITSSSGTNGTISPFTPQTVNYGSSVTFTVMPAAGYHVRDVLVDGNSVGAVTSCTFTGVMASHTITAAFSINTYAITVISGPRGVVTPCTGLLPYHTTQAYVVKPGAGYMINTLTVDGVVVNEATERLGYTVTLTSIEGPHTIAATFVPIPDLTAPTITFPRFNAVAGVSDWSDGAVQMFTVSVSPFALSFTLEDDSGSAKWTVKNNGCAVVGSIDSGVISCPLPLSEGRNDVEIITSDVPGNSSRRKLCIYLDSMSPVLRLDPSLPASISVAEATVKGSVSDAGSGLKHLVINGAEVIPYVDGSFGEKVMLARGANVIVIEAEDRVGHVTSATYRVTYAPPVPAPVAGHAMQLAIGSKTMSVDGMKVTLDAPAQIVQDRTLVPLRGLVEQLGGTTAWNAKARQVTLKARGTTMVLTIGKSSALVNGRGQPIDPTNGNVVPLLMSDRTMLPLRFVAENLGLQVAWNANTRVVTLSWED